MYRLFFLCFICLFSCHPEEDINFSDFTPPQKQFITNSYLKSNIDLDKYCVDENPFMANKPQGSYSNRRGISGGATLVIKVNNIFEYSFQGCLGSSKSKGSWVQFGNTITLNSFPEYKRDFNRSDSISPAHRNFKEIQKAELVNWKLKVGEDFLISEGMGNNTNISIYEKEAKK